MSLEMRDGSVKTLWTVSLPLILTFLSTFSMAAIDRLFLARYSVEALSAAVSGGTAAWAFTLGGQTLTNISGVFVAQKNGAKQYSHIGRPVWQTLWLSLFFIIPFTVAAIWFSPWLFSGSPIGAEQVLYFRWIMAISPLICIQSGINGFYIGRGYTSIITYLTLIGNLVNFVLDPLLIFGFGPIPSLGISGACIATGAGLFLQTAIGFFIFIKKNHRKKYGTQFCGIHWKTLKEMVRIGAPEALAASLEIGAWAAFYCLLSGLSTVHILVTSVGQSLLITFFFFGIGLEQGISSICGNLIGANLKQEVQRAFHSGLKIVGLFGVFLLSLFWIGGDVIVDLFLRNPDHLEETELISSLSPQELTTVRGCVLKSCFVIGVYIVIENVRCLLYGVLRSAGDTFFILVISILTTWSLLIGPTYLLMAVWKMPVDISFWIWIAYASASTLICYSRFSSGSWIKNRVVQT